MSRRNSWRLTQNVLVTGVDVTCNSQTLCDLCVAVMLVAMANENGMCAVAPPGGDRNPVNQ